MPGPDDADATPSASDRPTDPLEAPGPEVWVATWDLGGMRRLGFRLQGRAALVPVREVGALALARPSTVVLLDACAGKIDPVEAAPLLAGTGASVVVWGASAQLRRRLREERGTERWLHVPQDTTPQELAAILGGLLA